MTFFDGSTIWFPDGSRLLPSLDDCSSFSLINCAAISHAFFICSFVSDVTTFVGDNGISRSCSWSWSRWCSRNSTFFKALSNTLICCSFIDNSSSIDLFIFLYSSNCFISCCSPSSDNDFSSLSSSIKLIIYLFR